MKTGPKTFNFFHNILRPDDPNYVTIDRHAYAIAKGDNAERLTQKQYLDVANHYVRSANRLGILPNQLQAVLWVDYRTKYVNTFKEFCPF